MLEDLNTLNIAEIFENIDKFESEKLCDFSKFVF